MLAYLENILNSLKIYTIQDFFEAYLFLIEKNFSKN
jgi:hypothetical protein